MLKKILTASLVLAASSSVVGAVYANMPHHKGMRDYKAEVVPAPCCKRSFACGPYLGLSAGLRSNYTSEPAVFHGFEGLLSVGYATMLSPDWYLGAELFGGDSVKLSDYKVGRRASVRSTWSYGFSLLPGMMITDNVLGYLRASVIEARFNKHDVNRTGWQLGLGAETNLCDGWDLRMEYDYSQYGKLRTNRFDTTTRMVTHHHTIPRADQFNIGVVYKFV